jgi:hypothetical protein
MYSRSSRLSRARESLHDPRRTLVGRVALSGAHPPWHQGVDPGRRAVARGIEGRLS